MEGRGSVRTITTNWARYLSSVFEERGRGRAFASVRDTFAVELLLAGVPIDQVSMLLGHRPGCDAPRDAAGRRDGAGDGVTVRGFRAWPTPSSLAPMPRGAAVGAQ